MKYDVIIFDLDSTLVAIEGLDWLAKEANKGKRVAQLTKLSMEGKLDFNQALQEKIKIISPTKKDFIKLGNHYCQTLLEGTEDLVKTLHKFHKEVYLFTGNFQPAVDIVAKKLGIKKKYIYTNQVKFNKHGQFLSFDITNPLARNGGKLEVVKKIKKPGQRIVFVGDSVTDLDTKPAVDLFIGFGGVAKREKVKKEADVFIDDKSLLPILNFILTDEEKAKLML